MQFLSPSVLAYGVDDGGHTASAVYQANLTTGATSLVLATTIADIIAWNMRPDGSITYYTAPTVFSGEVEWHLKSGSSDRLLASWPFPGGRGGSFDYDSNFVGFSPDGRYVALVTTFPMGGTLRGEHAPFQIRNPAGALIDSYPADDSASTPDSFHLRTMAMWSRVRPTLYFRDSAGTWQWDATSGARLTLPGAVWVGPVGDSSGSWIAYSSPGSDGRHRISIWNVATGAAPLLVTAYGRTRPTFIGTALLHYNGEMPCHIECLYYPNNVGYLYGMPGGPEVASRLVDVLATWNG